MFRPLTELLQVTDYKFCDFYQYQIELPIYQLAIEAYENGAAYRVSCSTSRARQKFDWPSIKHHEDNPEFRNVDPKAFGL